MRPVRVSLSSVSASIPMVVDNAKLTTNIAIGVVSTGTATFSVQHTYSDVLDPLVTPVWFNLSTITAATANAEGSYSVPIVAVRLNVTAWTSGTVTMNMIQAG